MQGKVAVVTGAASGIGEATAKELAARGAAIVIADLDDANGRRVTEEIASAGGEARFCRTDVSAETDADAMVAFAVDSYGRLDLAVNNAGIGHLPGPMHELGTEAWDQVLAVDLRGVFFCLRAELRYMVTHGGGAVVNMASGAGLKAAAGMHAYVAAKHGVVGLTRNAALDYAAAGIRVNAVAPGTISTPQMHSFPQEQQDEWAGLIPMGRMGTPEEVAALIAFLLSDEASFMTGAVVPVDGAFLQSSKG